MSGIPASDPLQPLSSPAILTWEPPSITRVLDVPPGEAGLKLLALQASCVQTLPLRCPSLLHTTTTSAHAHLPSTFDPGTPTKTGLLARDARAAQGAGAVALRPRPGAAADRLQGAVSHTRAHCMYVYVSMASSIRVWGSCLVCVSSLLALPVQVLAMCRLRQYSSAFDELNALGGLDSAQYRRPGPNGAHPSAAIAKRQTNGGRAESGPSEDNVAWQRSLLRTLHPYSAKTTAHTHVHQSCTRPCVCRARVARAVCTALAGGAAAGAAGQSRLHNRRAVQAG